MISVNPGGNMGGMGSGRRWSSKNTTDDYRSMDIRKLDRKQLLRAGAQSELRWSGRRGDASIGVRAENGRLILTYQIQRAGETWESYEYPVTLEMTPCHFGGVRVWFRCPEVRCGRRVAVLYFSRYLVCRHCLRLAYESQRESPLYRALYRAQAISGKLGMFGDTDCPAFRPKGMHKRTFQRIERKYDLAVWEMNARAAIKFGVNSL
jgi:hypothetical protein